MHNTRNKFTPRRRAAFIASLRPDANVSAAAREQAISRRSVYRWRREDPEFAAEWDDAVEEAIDDLEAAAMRRARDGVDRPRYHRGVRCGGFQLHSDAMTMFLLRGRRPWRYGHAAALARQDAARAKGRARGRDLARDGKPPVVVELVHFGDAESFAENKAALAARRAAGDPTAPPGVDALRDRLEGGTCLGS